MKLSFIPDNFDWLCRPCEKKMEPGMVTLAYMGNEFRVELPVCPQCGAVFIPEDLALGKMLEVEQLLEDK